MSKSMRRVLAQKPIANLDEKMLPCTDAVMKVYARLANNELDDRLWYGIYNPVYETVSSNPIYSHLNRNVSSSDVQDT